MRLYHGSNQDFTTIDLNKSQRFKDFGQGFYLTDLRHQAERMAEKKTRLFGGHPVVQEYEFDESLLRSDEMKVLVFDNPSVEWADFIFKNRKRTLPRYTHSYDIVVGPIADDGVAYLLGRYEEGTLDLEGLAKELEYKHLNSQYYFGSLEALKHLRRI